MVGDHLRFLEVFNWVDKSLWKDKEFVLRTIPIDVVPLDYTDESQLEITCLCFFRSIVLQKFPRGFQISIVNKRSNVVVSPNKNKCNLSFF